MTNSNDQPRYCVIGAGASGLAIAKELQERGISFDCFEKNDSVGGNWYNGVYDSIHLITSREASGFTGFPMPKEYPAFPSRAQMLAYIEDFADQYQLRRHIQFNTEVVDVRPVDDTGLLGWRVVLSDGEERAYSGVIVANGHLWNKRVPGYAGEFTGKSLHSRDYKNVNDVDGDRVLVVGVGNSGLDLAVDAAHAGFETLLSARRGKWFLPKTFFGVPRGELKLARLPVPLQMALTKVLVRISVGRPERYGLPEPEADNLIDDIPPVNSQALYWLQHGRISVVPEIDRFEGRSVHFVDGSEREIDTILWATGYNISFPFLDHDLLEWESGVPRRYAASTVAPGLAGLYFAGLVAPRGGQLPIYSASARLIADCVLAQENLDHPIADEFAKRETPDAQFDFIAPRWFRRLRNAEALVDSIRKQHKRKSHRHSSSTLVKVR